MEKVQKLYRHPLYRECLEKNKKAEETRIFCKHGMEHFMDVARIAYILSVDRAYAVSKEDVYKRQDRTDLTLRLHLRSWLFSVWQKTS